MQKGPLPLRIHRTSIQIFPAAFRIIALRKIHRQQIPRRRHGPHRRSAELIHQQPGQRQRRVVHRLGFHAEPALPRNQTVIRIFLLQLRRDRRRLPVRPAHHNRAHQLLHVPALLKLRRQPVEQFRMHRRLPLRAQIVQRLRNTGPEKLAPHPVHIRPRGQRILFRHQPVRQIEPRRPSLPRIELAQKRRNRRLHDFGRVIHPVRPRQDVRNARLRGFRRHHPRNRPEEQRPRHLGLRGPDQRGLQLRPRKFIELQQRLLLLLIALLGLRFQRVPDIRRNAVVDIHIERRLRPVVLARVQLLLAVFQFRPRILGVGQRHAKPPDHRPSRRSFLTQPDRNHRIGLRRHLAPEPQRDHVIPCLGNPARPARPRIPVDRRHRRPIHLLTGLIGRRQHQRQPRAVHLRFHLGKHEPIRPPRQPRARQRLVLMQIHTERHPRADARPDLHRIRVVIRNRAARHHQPIAALVLELERARRIKRAVDLLLVVNRQHRTLRRLRRHRHLPTPRTVVRRNRNLQQQLLRGVVEFALGLRSRGRQRIQLRLLLRRGQQQLRPPRALAAIRHQTGLFNIGEERFHRIKVFRGKRIEFMVVTLRAAHRGTQPRRAQRAHPVRAVLRQILLGLQPAFRRITVHPVIRRRDFLLHARIRQQIPGQLFPRENVERLVIPKCPQHIIPIGPRGPEIVAVEARGIRVAHRIQPVHRLLLGIMRRREQPVHHLAPRLGRPVILKCRNLFRSRRQPSQIE